MNAMSTKPCIVDIETEDLDPRQGRIVCIGIKDCVNGEFKCFFDDDEKALLEAFFGYYREKGFNEVVGYNLPFDIQFIFARCLKYGIPGNGFFFSKHHDLMKTMISVKGAFTLNRRPGKLAEWTQFAFKRGKMEKSGSIKELYKRRDITQIKNYNKQDVEITYQLWRRVKQVLWSDPNDT